MPADVKIVIAAHKPCWTPHDPLYVPVQVGAAGKEAIPGFQRDDSGENISEQNPHLCELTALYWAWRNLDAQHIGLSHYRRYFGGSGEKGLLSLSDAQQMLRTSSVVLPNKRRYYIETVGDHYSHTFDASHLAITRDVLAETSPWMINAFDHHLNERSAHIWNMSIMRRDILDEWCSWLFPTLEEIEKRIDFEGMTPFEARVTGRIAERLLDPWLLYNNINAVECPVVSTEKTNWLKKGSAFLLAKYAGKKYQESF